MIISSKNQSLNWNKSALQLATVLKFKSRTWIDCLVCSQEWTPSMRSQMQFLPVSSEEEYFLPLGVERNKNSQNTPKSKSLMVTPCRSVSWLLLYQLWITLYMTMCINQTAMLNEKSTELRESCYNIVKELLCIYFKEFSKSPEENSGRLKLR